jgi:outer membrane protein OmpA-like peptidoglycan-associated protein
MNITKKGKFFLGLGVMLIVGTLAYFFVPGVKSLGSTTIKSMNISKDEINNISDVEKIDLPSNVISQKNNSEKIRIMEYGWSANLGQISANGGRNTKEGSIYESLGLNVEIVKQNSVTELMNALLKSVQEIEEGKVPNCDQCATFVSIMGDGVPEFASKLQKTIDSKYNGKYHVEVPGVIGLSYGEDKLIGPIEWKTNPASMIGKTISTAVADGDFILALNYIGLQGSKFKINRDLDTYDPNAINFHHCENGDFEKAGEELIKSQLQGWTVTKKLVNPDGTLGKEVQVKIDGCSTWFPADKNVFDALSGFTVIASTKDFKNQMATTLVGIKEYNSKNFNSVTNLLKGAYMSADQIKTNPQWKEYAYKFMAEVYGEDAAHWKLGFEGMESQKNGVPYTIGGSRVFNLADAKLYYGLTDGINRYKTVWEQVSNYLVELNPFDFNNAIGKPLTFDKVVNMGYISSVNLDSKIEAYEDNVATASNKVFSDGAFSVNFSPGSNKILPSSYKVLDKLYGQLLQAESMNIDLAGHTDKTGSDVVNIPLSKARAEAVGNYLVSKGLKKTRIVSVEGYGSTKPIGTDSENRRVNIKLLN